MTPSLPTIARLMALALLAVSAMAPAWAASTNVKVKVKVVKPLVLTVKQQLEFGQILLSGAVGTSTVSLSAAGVLSCGSGLICSGVSRPAIFNVTGSGGQVVRIVASASELTNAADGSKLSFTPIAPASVTLTNSGNQGLDFGVGGSISIPSTAEGIYSGPIEVTVDYQ